MKTAEIRQKFLEFFESKKHTAVDSAPIVVKNDPTLMFTNAGMNQFKDIFLGNEPAANERVVDTQKCLRVSGKHNDLEEVGVDTYHHTMFEMLGNWSFGDYYKKEAIEWAWELLTEVYKIDKSRIYVTVFEGDKDDHLEFDQEAFDVWKNLIAEERIISANKKDNFWEMGDVGPCGPCSEIHVDMRSDSARASSNGRDLVNHDHPEVIEIWNLVFMELQRKSDGKLIPLKSKHIDTGMGLERLAMVLQGKQSTYDTDIFVKLIDRIEKETGKKYGFKSSKSDIAIRVMADHVRAVAFAIADGQMPSNTGAGYVIRRILRRAIRYAYSFLDVREPILYKLAEELIALMGGFFEELNKNSNLIIQVVKEEEESFLKTLARGIDLIEKISFETKGDSISGQVVFELYDTYGFPADLTGLILSEKGKSFDEKEFEAELEKQKNRSRKAANQETGDWIIVNDDQGVTSFVGYDSLQTDLKIMRYRKVNQKGKDLYQMVFDRTPFYPEGGGQVGDQGFIQADGAKIPIIGTFRENNLIIHLTNKSPEGVNESVTGFVASDSRKLTAKNHTATHLLHYALRKVLGTHVEQKGSLVEKDYLRFDFSHFSKMADEEIRKVEIIVNKLIREDIALDERRNTPMQEAKDLGAMALFGEKYGDEVRVIKFGDSVELCGGTHVQRTGEIGFFKITSEGSVAAGIRRIEAITADAAQTYLFDQIDVLSEIKGLLKSPGNPSKSIKDILESQQKLTKEIEQLHREKAGSLKDGLVKSIQKINGINFIAAEVDLDAALIKDLAFQLRKERAPLFLVLATAEKEKATISVALSDELVNQFNAGNIVRELSTFIQGGGGGQAFFATAGGKNPAGVDQALNRAKEILSES
ncbi:alanine--tRNA ligase [Cryomorpha ignava]|uniref:Alanine--tRNA ligase n=1 Tax=Cryomorpha ignava TaxID=101383 RepID=A0A7K3WPI2_9FLAO|nr:alanine--tRNA ligase [Cryomorpha ignava]NEN22941.1 alanine--tRNA ligase [Cryomorpha ignava]